MAACVLLWTILVLVVSHSEAGEVCYGKYGCFNSNAPFNRFGIPLPQSPAQVQTTFHVVTNSASNEIDDSSVAKLQASGYDSLKKTVIIIHGWSENVDESQWLIDMKAAFLAKIDGNLIIVDWKEGAAKLYTQSVANTRLVGSQVAELIKFINFNKGNNPSSFHVIGFSLGAQIAGYVGRRLQSTKIARITGLDPAGPYYTGEHVDVRLDSSDAAFVDVIHTDSGVAGTSSKSGHMDFYPNNGKKQRGCSFGFSGSALACDHIRAPRYYIDSILYSCKFKAHPCSNWDVFTHGQCMSCPSSGCPEMGHYADNIQGFFSSSDLYLYTNIQSPYCVFQYAYVTFISDSGWFAGGRNPKIRFLGSNGRNSEHIELEKRDLAAGSTEKFIAPINQDLGTLTAIEVWNDLGSAADGWKLKQVNVQLISSGQMYHACYNGAWIYTSAVERDLAPGTGSC